MFLLNLVLVSMPQGEKEREIFIWNELVRSYPIFVLPIPSRLEEGFLFELFNMPID